MAVIALSTLRDFYRQYFKSSQSAALCDREFNVVALNPSAKKKVNTFKKYLSDEDANKGTAISFNILDSRLELSLIPYENKYFVAIFTEKLSFAASKNRDYMISALAHDVKLPVSTIASAASLLKQKLPKEFIENFEIYFNIIDSNCNQVMRSINHAIDVIKFESQDYKLNISSENISEMLKDLHSGLSPYLEKSGIPMIMKMPAKDIYCYIDRQALNSALLNIITNSVKYTRKNNQITVSLKVEKDTVTITIKDKGAGIEEKHLPKIFEAFYTAGGTDSVVSGSGVGLYITYNIIKLHKGKIYAESEKGKGTVMTITLPYKTGGKSKSGLSSSDDKFTNSLKLLIQTETETE